ncbi:MAG TPA: CocE/NonD family hydrolase [Candidatus Cryosericum sp.]|nr:CocE/NonD family hydrolase [Candidatus Cryosericum sp.]
MSRPSRRAGLMAAPLCMALLLGSGCVAQRPGSPAGSAQEASPAVAARSDHPNLVVERNVPVRMRDGVLLRADVYRPAGPGRYPVLVMRTPYGKDGAVEEGSEPTIVRAPREGYAVVVQDVRGRFNSDGTFRPYHQEGADGHDTVEWAAVQPWSNGRVGTFGLSYPGAAQWLLAMETPPHLVSIFPAMTFATGRQFFYFGGAFNHDWMRWIALYIAPEERRRRGLQGPRTEKEAEAVWAQRKWEWEKFVPLLAFPELQDVAPWYFEWLRHPDDSDYWAFADVVAAHRRIAVPAMNFSSWYDSNYGPNGAIANFNGVRAAGATEAARRGQRLILGPWDHGDPSVSETKVGDLSFGPNMTIDYYGLILRWHDRFLKGIGNGIDEGPPVRLFVMGENVWRDEREWPLARTQYVPYYLRGSGAARGGRLSSAPPGEGEPAERYDYDPRDPVVIENFELAGPYDRSGLESRRDVLSFTTAPLEEDLEVTGPVTVHLFASTSAPDTDFIVMLLDVHPDGRAYNLMPLEAGAIRARYRDSERTPKMMPPGDPVEFTIGGMVTSNLFLKGHRIRLHVTSSRFPVFDRNPNTGEPFGTSARMETAHQTVFLDAARPSRLVLPIIPRPR